MQFSQDNTNWYSAVGVLDATTNIPDGTTTTSLPLSPVWSGGNLYYKIIFSSSDDRIATPTLSQMSVNYNTDTAPTLTSVSNLPNPIKGGSTITITPAGQGDAESNTLLYYYCNETGSAGGQIPTSANTLCSQANTSSASSYSAMTCSYAVTTGNATRNVYCRTYDGALYSTEQTVTYLVDTTVPAIASTTFSGFTTSSTFIKGTGTIIGGTAEDTGGSGVDTTTCEYTIDNGSNWLAGAWSTNHCQKTSVTISNTTSYTFNTRVKDLVVNQGTGTATSTYTGDTQAPSTTDNSNTTWQNTNQTITLTPTDGTGSGVAHTYYCVYNSGDTACTPTTEGTSVIVSCAVGNNCHQYIRYYSTDNLDNTEATKTSSLIRIDKINPIVSAGDNYATGSATGQSVQFTQVGAVTDPDIGAESGSGIATYLWQKVSGPGGVTFGSATQVSTTIWSPTDGTYVISLTVTDNAGNTSTDDFTLLWSTTLPSTSNIDTTRIGGNNAQAFASNALDSRVRGNDTVDSQAQIQTMLAIIENLKAQIIALINKNTPQPTITPNMPIADISNLTSQSSTAYIFTQTLKLGSTGNEVKQLQIKLQTLGFFPQEIIPTNYFGKITLKALQDFQTDRNITSSGIYGYGIVGPKTRAVLNGIR
jgi:hypothetical protein